jgi:TPR repeat protein
MNYFNPKLDFEGSLYRAKEGYIESQLYVADIYEFGNEFIKSDSKKAFSWYKLAADNNEPEARYRLAYKYEKGDGVEQNLGLAKDHLFKCAAQGFGPCYNKLGDFYLNGIAVKKSKSIAYAFYLLGYDKSINPAIESKIKLDDILSKQQISMGQTYKKLILDLSKKNELYPVSLSPLP